MIWVRCCKGEPIPEDFEYPDWQTDRDDYDNTPLMLWIISRKGEPIPEDFEYPDWQTDRN